MNIKNLMMIGQRYLVNAGIEENDAFNDVRFLLAEVLDMDYGALRISEDKEVPEEKEKTYLDYIKKRSERIPCQVIVGKAYFYVYEFYVDGNCLVPRPETEILVEKALELCKGKAEVSALDICTGSGCIGVTFAKEREKAGKTTKLVMSDYSEDALKVATKNSEMLDNSPELIFSDMYNNIDGLFDIIMSNPPYIKDEDILELEVEVKEHDPYMALSGGVDGLKFYRILAKESKNYLTSGGYLIMEIGYDQYEEVKELLLNENYKNITLVKDYSGLDRIVICNT